MEKIVSELCISPTTTMATATVRADKMGIDRRVLQRNLPLLASALLNADNACYRGLTEVLAKSGLRCMLFLEHAAYDETPMTVRCEEIVYSVTQKQANPDHNPEGQNTLATQRSLVKIESTTEASDTGPSKLFQTLTSFVLLLKNERAPADEDKYIQLRGQPLSTVQFLSSTAAPVLKAALRAASCVPVASREFEMKVRAATSDKYAANALAEREVMAERGTAWLGLRSDCDIHCVAGSQTKSLDLFGDFVSLMVNLALSLRLVGNMRRFRACLKAVVRKRLQLLPGDPPATAAIYREHILNLFCSQGPRAADRWMHLCTWFNGDWQNLHKIEHYCSGPVPTDEGARNALVANVVRAATSALAHRAPSTFPRSRWTGSELATDDLGLMLSVHGLLQHAYVAFLVASGHKLARRFVGYDWSESRLPVEDGSLEQNIQPPEEDEADPAEVDVADNAERPSQEEAIIDQSLGKVDWQALNHKFRSHGFAFVRNKPLGRLMVLRRCIEPFRVCLAQHFELASERWEVKQRAKEASKLKGDQGDTDREYRVVIAAAGTLEAEFVRRVKELFFDSSLWECLPRSCFTVEFRGFVFRVLSRMGCCAEQLLALPHTSFPVRLFLLLQDDSLAEDFAQARDCELDDFSRGFIEQFREVGLSHPDALMVLRSVAAVWRMDISNIEARHATLRRLLMSAPQTKAMSAETLSALFLCQRYAKRQAQVAPPRPAKVAGKKEKAKPRSTKRRRDKRSAWHVFVSENAGGRPATDPALSLQYKNLTKLKKDRLQVRADKSNETADKEGPRRRRLQQFRQGSSSLVQYTHRQTLAKRRASLPTEERLSQIIKDVVSTRRPFEETLRLAKRARRQDAAQVRELDKKDELAVVQFRDENIVRNKEALVSVCPASARHQQDLASVPLQGCSSFDWLPPAVGMAADAVSLANDATKLSNLGIALKLDWARRVATVGSDSMPPLPEPPQAPGHKCRMAGECLCSEEGKVLNAFTVKVLSFVKAQVKQSAKLKDDLLQGKLVLVLLEAVVPEGGRSALEDLPDPDFSEAAGADWLHIGLHYLRPYRPTFQCLVPSAKTPFVDDGVSLRATGDFVTLHRRLAAVDKNMLVWAGCFRLWESAEPLADFVPAEICVRAVSPPEIIWLGSLRRQRLPRPRQDGAEGPMGPGGGLPPALEDEEAMAEVEEEEDIDNQEAQLDEVEGDQDDDEGLSFEDLLAAMLPGDEDSGRAGDSADQGVEEPCGADVPGPDAADELGDPVVARAGLPGSDGDLALAGLENPVLPPPIPLVAEFPAPPPPPPAPLQDHQRRTAGVHPTDFCGGRITFYPDKNDPTKGRFQANCGNVEKHGKLCRLTRTCNLPVRPEAYPHQGRPLGLLAAWLRVAFDQGVDDASDHLARVHSLGFDERQLARVELLAEPSGEDLAGCERPQRDDESEEPEGLA